jgi:thioredoxin 1
MNARALTRKRLPARHATRTCRAVAPILAEIASEKGDALRVVKLNVDENPDITQRLGVMSIPTLILFAKGEEKARIVGARAKEQLLKDIDPHLNGA